MMHRKCPICGADFHTNNGNAKYCSAECRKIGYQKRIDKFKENNPDYQKDYRAKNKKLSTQEEP